MIKKLTLILILISLPFTSLKAEASPKSITIAVLPCTDIVMTFKKFHPLVTYLTQKTGMSVRLVVPENMTRFEASLNNEEIDFALQDPHTFSSWPIVSTRIPCSGFSIKKEEPPKLA